MKHLRRNYASKVRSYTPWSHEEDAALLRLSASGMRHRQIAIEIGRSHGAICNRLTQKYSIYINRAPLPVVHTVTISKSDLPSYYELGWRVAWFEADQVGLEWRGNGEPLYPAEEMRRAA